MRFEGPHPTAPHTHRGKHAPTETLIITAPRQIVAKRARNLPHQEGKNDEHAPTGPTRLPCPDPGRPSSRPRRRLTTTPTRLLRPWHGSAHCTQAVQAAVVVRRPPAAGEVQTSSVRFLLTNRIHRKSPRLAAVGGHWLRLPAQGSHRASGLHISPVHHTGQSSTMAAYLQERHRQHRTQSEHLNSSKETGAGTGNNQHETLGQAPICNCVPGPWWANNRPKLRTRQLLEHAHAQLYRPAARFVQRSAQANRSASPERTEHRAKNRAQRSLGVGDRATIA
jgi:hypothetical protein